MEVALSPSPESWLPSDGIWEGQMAIEEADGGGLWSPITLFAITHQTGAIILSEMFSISGLLKNMP